MYRRFALAPANREHFWLEYGLGEVFFRLAFFKQFGPSLVDEGSVALSFFEHFTLGNFIL